MNRWRLKALEWKVYLLTQKVDAMAKTLTELNSELTTVKDQQVKVFTEVSSLVARVGDLEAQLANQTLPQATQDAWDALKAQTQKVDDLIPDAPPPA